MGARCKDIAGSVAEEDLVALPGLEEVDDPGVREPSQPGMVGRLADGEVVLHLLKDRPRHHIAPGKRLFREPVEECAFTGGERSGPGGKRRRPDGGDDVEDVLSGDAEAAVLLGPHGSRPEEGDPDPDVPLAGGHLRDKIEDRRRHHPGVEPLPDAVGEDIADLGPRVGQEGDLGRAEDRPDARIGLRVEVQGEIARDREDHGTPDLLPPLVEPEELVEEDVVGAGRDEVVGVVEADEEAGILLPEPGGDRLPGVVEVPGGGCVAEEVLCDAPVDGEQGVVLPAVDVDRDELPGEFGEGPADGGGLPGPRRPAEDGVPGAGALEEEGEFLDLGVAVVEVVGHVGEVKDVGIPEEGLVGAEKAFHRRDWRRGDC